MYSLKSVSFKILVVLMAVASIVTVNGVYNTTPRDTSPAPPVYNYQESNLDGTDAVHINGDFEYYIDDERDIITVHDTRNGYEWKTGLDIAYNTTLKDECKVVEDQFEEQFEDLELAVIEPTETYEPNLLLESFPNIYGILDPSLSSTYIVDNGVLEVRNNDLEDLYVDATEDDQEKVKLVIGDLNLEAGKTYQISIDMAIPGVRDIEIQLGSEYSEVFTTEKSFVIETFTFTHTQTASETDTELVLNLGYFVDSEEFDLKMRFGDFKLEEVVDEAVVDDTNQVTYGAFDIDESKYDVTVDELLEVCSPIEEKMNEYFTAFANSLVTIEYYDISDVIRYASSSAKNPEDQDPVVSSFFHDLEDNDDSTWVLVVDFIAQDIQLNVYVNLTEDGLELDIPNDEIQGSGTDRLASIILTPFQGASGGYSEFYDASDIYDVGYSGEVVKKEEIPGYFLIPDGSGTLIRFEDYNTKLDRQMIYTYGENPTEYNTHESGSVFYVPFKTLSMPVLGVSHGDNQAGFVQFATSGDEYMTIEIWPEDYITFYTNAFMKFEYNTLYKQVYNKSGQGNTQLKEEYNDFDIHVVYSYLDGTSTEGERADYVGMAQKYGEYLFGDESKKFDYNEIPIRLDFLMSDSEKSLVGYSNQVTTDVDGVERILNDIIGNGISNINSGLLGWNDGGITLGDPRKLDFTSVIGRKGEFEDLINGFDNKGVDISLSNDYFWINDEIMGYRGNAATHINSWYAFKYIFEEDIERFYYARPVNSTEWMFDQMEDMDKLGVSSYTITGITNNLISDYSNEFLRTDTKDHFVNAFSKISSSKLVNAYQPNAYLLPYVDRYLQAPVFGTQYLIETDTVPFVQLVLRSNMELYSPYANFSFYTDSDVLRMIDYNVYPSFILTDQPAHLLTDTMSSNYYSTEYQLYEDAITRVYNDVNGALGTVINADWDSRIVVEPGVIVNTYSNGVKIVINYTDQPITYEGEIVESVSYEVLGGSNG